MNENDVAVLDQLITACWQGGGMRSPQFANACATLLRKVQAQAGMIPPEVPAAAPEKK